MSEPNADAAPLPDRARERIRNISAALAVVVILAMGAGLRFTNLDWDSGRHLHPDERYMTYLATLLRPPDSLADYFDSGASPLNPYNTDWGSRYVYGTLPLFIARYAAAFLDGACESPPRAAPALVARLVFPPRYAACEFGPFTSYDPMALVGRALSSLADLAAIVAVYFIGRRLFGRRAGLLAAVLSALTVLQIQQAHFFTTDSMSNLFVVLTILTCVWLVTSRSVGRAFWLRAGVLGAAAGVFAGLGVASKISVWPLVPLIVLSYAVVWWRQSRQHPPGAAALALGGALVISGLTAFTAFRIAQPYSFVGTSYAEFVLTIDQCEIVASGGLATVCRLAAELPEPIRVVVAPSARWIEQLTLAQGFVNGTIDAPFGIQWSNRAPIAFPLVNLLFFGMGLALGLAGWVGFIIGARETLLGRRWWLWLIPVVWTGAYFLYQSTQWTKSIRYLLPIYPMLALFAAAALIALWDRARTVATPRRTAASVLAASAAALVVGLTAVWAAAFLAVYAGPTTRVAASDWIYRNVPSAVTLEWDAGADGRQLAIKSMSIETGAPTSFPISRLDLGDAPVSLTAVRVRLNHLDGEGVVTARVLDLLTDTLLAEAQATVSGSQPVIAFDGLELQRGRDYFVELQLAPARGGRREITARASVIGNEQWDDPLPAPGEGRASGLFYNGLTTSNSGLMQPYDEDSPDKLPALLDWLDETDYVVLSSNRVYASVARLPWRYPLTNEYYRALLGGELGFELAADFHSYPRLAGFTVNTHEMPQRLVRAAGTQGPALGTVLPFPPAEEAFSVYDHPRVLIFRKTQDYSRERAERLLGVFDLARTLRVTPIQAGNQPGGLVMTPSMRETQQAGGTWTELFPESSPLNQSEFVAALAWLALIEMLGLAAFPLIARLSRGALFDGGYAVSKVLGLLLVAYGAWLAASVGALPFSAGVIWAMAGALGVVGAAFAWRDRAFLAALVRERGAVVLGAEMAFLIGFAVWLAVRSGNPDLWHPFMGGEKPMDFAYLNAILRSTWFPPIDPWFSGGYINYYYFGFVIVAAPIKALGIEPAVAYNLAVPTLFGLVASGAYGLGAALAARTTDAASTRRAIVAGALAALFVAGIGNAQQLWVISGAWTRLGGGDAGVPEVEAFFRGLAAWLAGAPLPVYAMAPYWDATRIDPSVPIAEFPLFTFLYADLHAHMIAMPIVLLSIAIALIYASGRASAIGVAIGALVVGSLFPTNSWDYPIYLALCATALVVGRLRGHSAGQGEPTPWTMVAAAIAVFVALSRGWFAPFFEHFGTTYSSVDVWTQGRTPLLVYLKIHGLLLAPIAAYLARGALQSARALAAAGRRGTLAWAGAAGVAVMALAGAFAVVGVPTALVSIPVAALAAMAAIMPGTLGRTRVLWLAVAGAAALTLFVELFALRGDIGRMNTVFKFYVQAWLLFGVGAAVTSTWLLARPTIAQAGAIGQSPRRAASFAVAAMVASVAGVGLVYPLFAVPAKVNDRMAADAPRGLDGEAYMRYSTRVEQGREPREFSLRHDAGAIEWLRRNVTGSPTIMEGTAGGELYRWGNRMSIYTGLPSVVGWWWHQHQQRMALPYSVVSGREQDVAAFYSTRDTGLAQTLLRRYTARYVVLGDLERAYYDPAGLPKFARLVSEGVLRVAYRNEGTTIYEVMD